MVISVVRNFPIPLTNYCIRCLGVRFITLKPSMVRPNKTRSSDVGGVGAVVTVKNIRHVVFFQVVSRRISE